MIIKESQQGTKKRYIPTHTKKPDEVKSKHLSILVTEKELNEFDSFVGGQRQRSIVIRMLMKNYIEKQRILKNREEEKRGKYLKGDYKLNYPPNYR